MPIEKGCKQRMKQWMKKALKSTKDLLFQYLVNISYFRKRRIYFILINENKSGELQTSQPKMLSKEGKYRDFSRKYRNNTGICQIKY